MSYSPIFNNDSGDSLPEEISFKAEEERLLNASKNTLYHVKSQKVLLKNKRRKMHERNKSQQQIKKRKLQDQKLSAEILENICDWSAKNIIGLNVKREKGIMSTEGSRGSRSSILENDNTHVHGVTVFKVKDIDSEVKKSSSVSEAATCFRKQALHGIRRESSKEYFARKERQKIVCK